ncbi:MAG: cysteine desulfurase family protein [Candidatus Eisenbacteria bacterium]
MERIYLDHNATTPTDPRVVEAMLPYFTRAFGNPSSAYTPAQETRAAVEESRAAVAAAIGCQPRCVVFTSGGSESDNMAIKGVALGRFASGGHIVTTKIEHHAVLHTCQYVRDRLGFDVTFLDVDASGRVDSDAVASACREDTVLITVMQANNETGVVEPIKEIASVGRERGILVHTDAVQAVGKMEVDVDDLGVDLLSLSAHKLYGPKGMGALYVRPGTTLDPLAHGGSHERGMRAGTENVPGIVGLATAVTIATAGLGPERARLTALTERLERGVEERIPEVTIHSRGTVRIAGTSNIAFHYVEGESIVLALDMEGMAVSTGSACTTDSAEPSHVLSAMGVAPNVAQGSVRFGLGRHTSEAQIDRLLSVLPGVVERLRAMSPLYRQPDGRA